MSNPTINTNTLAVIEKRCNESSAIVKALGVDADGFSRIVLNAMYRNPNLLQCTQRSIEIAIMDSAQSGLLPDNDEACLIPFKSEIKFIPMVNGLLKLAHQATPGLTIRSGLVYPDDEFLFVEGLQPRLEVIPDLSSNKREPTDIIAGFAVAWFPKGQMPEYEVMTRKQVAPRVKDTDPWRLHYEEMFRKTVLRRLLKRLPKSGSLRDLPDHEDFFGDEFAMGGRINHGTVTVPMTPALPNPAQRPQLDAPPQEEIDQAVHNLREDDGGLEVVGRDEGQQIEAEMQRLEQTVQEEARSVKSDEEMDAMMESPANDAWEDGGEQYSLI